MRYATRPPALTFTKRQKEQTRQQKQREKAERRTQRKQEKPADSNIDEMAELREHAAAQAALFNVGMEDADENGAEGNRTINIRAVRSNHDQVAEALKLRRLLFLDEYFAR